MKFRHIHSNIWIYSGLSLIICLLVSVYFFFSFVTLLNKENNMWGYALSMNALSWCQNTVIRQTVSGISMSPLLSDGQEIEVQQYTPECMTIERGDLVIYDYAQDITDANPVVKRVVGKWGDRFAYMSGKISINGEIQKNSSWVEYVIDSNMLALYARDYPIIPPRTLLILWEIPTGSRDSSAFWFISEDEIDGKVILP